VDLKASMGICKNLPGYKDKLIIIPENTDRFKSNDLVVVIQAQDFQNFTEGINVIIKFMESVKEDVDK
jgi:chemotaxis regulatin CheY-phosphate phosphatase CheZ